MKKVFLWIFLVGLFVTTKAQETFPINGIRDVRTSLYAFTNATIVQNEKTKIENATLLINQGKIIAVGTGVVIPKEAIVINCAGKFIYPSFIDPFTDYGVGGPKRAAGGFNYGAPGQFLSNKPGAYNWNQAVKPEINAADVFAIDEASATSFRANGFGTVFTHIKDGIARGTGAVVSLATENNNLALLKTKAAAVFSFEKGTSTQSYPSS